MLTVENLVRQYRTNVVEVNMGIDGLVEKERLFREAGFDEQHTTIAEEIILAKTVRSLGNAIFLKPPFIHNIYGCRHDIRFDFDGVLLKEVKTGWFARERTYLVECEPSAFLGKVPDNILRATAKAKSLNLEPKVWFVAKDYEVPQHMRVVHLDPAIVGYPIVGKRSDYAGGWDNVTSNRFCALIGLWGKDIEEISKVFDKKAQGDAE